MRRINHSSRFIEMFGTPENNHNCFPITNLGEICEIVGRIGFRGYTREDLVDNECDGAISLSPSNIIDGELDYTNSTYISWAKYNESPEIMINEGDIVLVKTASVGKCALVKVLPHEATINPQFVVLKKLKINPFYLNTCLQGDYGQRCIKSYTSGSTIPTFTQKQLATMSVVVPPSEKQKEFEVIVRQSDKSKFSDFKSRFIEMQRTSDYQNELGDFIERCVPERCGDRKLPVLSVTKEYAMVHQSERFEATVVSRDKSNYIVAPRGYLVQGIHIDESNFGIQNLVDEGIVSPAYKLWRFKNQDCIPELIEYYLRSEMAIKYFKRHFLGSTVPRRQVIKKDDFLSMPLNLPEKRIQERYFAFFQQADKSKYLN